MNIYFSCSITGGRKDQAVYRAIVDHLHAKGHVVPTAELADADVLKIEAVIDPRSVYERDVEWVSQSDVIIAEVSTPSHGVGYEIALALLLGKPVLCCYKAGQTVSKMITGNTHSTLNLVEYQHNDDALKAIDHFLMDVAKA